MSTSVDEDVQNCGTCRFYSRPSEVLTKDKPRNESDLVYGTCRRFPKNELKRRVEWCGEWKT